MLLDVAAAVADGVSVDWRSATQTLGNPDERRLLEGLRLIAEVTRSKRTDLALAPELDASPDPGLNPAHTTPDGRPFRDGEQWGPLKIIEHVGSGTFGDVYRAWDRRLDREVALKILRRYESEDGAASTVIEEGQLLARVRHPNVVTVYGAERVDGRIGVWMEFVHGRTLERELRDAGPFDLESLVRVGLELGDALGAVHRAGLLHRDVKTHNVMRDRDGRLLLTDFGAGERSNAGHTGEAVGTPLCVAPEVIAGKQASRQSDIYSLGVVLYRLATGRYPVDGRTLEEIHAAHEQGSRASLASLRPDLPAEILAAIERALDPDPARRYADADDLCVVFSSVAEQSGILPGRRVVYASAPRLRRYVLVSVAALALAALLATWWPKPHAPAIAVLPLTNLGADPNSGEIADGLTDEIIRQLTMIRGLDVRSRASSFSFKGTPPDVREAGRQLQSDFLLTGSVLRSEGRIRINAQLVRVSDDATVWAGKFDRDMKDIFGIQDEISRSIVNELRVKLDQRPRRYDIDVAIYERYLRARSLSERKDRDTLRTAIALYKEVAASEPRFAPAYAGLADAYADYEFWGVNYEDTYSEVRDAASKALALDPSLPEAHAAMGLVFARDRQWQLAERSFRHSIEINPNLSRTHRAFAFWLLYQQGRLDEAQRELQLALKHDPLSLDVRRMMAYVQLSAGKYAEALDNCRYVLKADPGFPLIRLVLARALLLTGNGSESIAVLEAMRPNHAPELGYAYAIAGRQAEAEALAQAAAGVPLTDAVIRAGLKDRERTLAALERAASIGDPKIGATLTYPELAFLRDDPRLAAFRRRLGLSPQ
jgi:serine/threonine-protein kinase